jgi:hypothetical protein
LFGVAYGCRATLGAKSEVVNAQPRRIFPGFLHEGKDEFEPQPE